MPESVKVLLVRDEEVAGTKKRSLPSKSNYDLKVVTVGDAADHIDKIAQKEYQAVIIDCEESEETSHRLVSQVGDCDSDLPVVVVDDRPGIAVSEFRKQTCYYISRNTDYFSLLSGVIDTDPEPRYAPVESVRATAGMVQCAFDSASPAMVLLDNEHFHIIEANQRACKLLEATKIELLGSPVEQHFSTDSNFDFAGFLAATLQNDCQQQKDISLAQQSGETVVVELQAQRLQEGDHEFLLLVCNDMSEKHHLERAVIQAEKLASVGLLASGIAHELRNPLNIIETARYYLETFLEKPNSDILAKLNIIGKNVKRSSGIINNLLEFARPATKDREVVSLKSLVENTVSLLGKELMAKNIELKLSLSDDCSTDFSKDTLKQVLLNLVINATQAMPKGGKLGIVTKRKKSGWIVMSISDTGVGIAKEHLLSIFTPFFTTKKGGEGTGLGLYIAHTLIEREGGKITVVSNKNSGTTFTVSVPEEVDALPSDA